MKNIVCCKDYMENLQRNDRRQVLHCICQSKLPIKGELNPIIERSFQKELLAYRGGFTVKIMKRKLHGPLLARAPYLHGPLPRPWEGP